MLNVEVARRRVSRVSDPCPLRRHRLHAVSVSSSKTVASVTSIERDYRGRAANERLSHRRAVPGDPHGAQTPAVRLQWGVWALECALALALRAIFSAPPAPKLAINISHKTTRVQ